MVIKMLLANRHTTINPILDAVEGQWVWCLTVSAGTGSELTRHMEVDLEVSWQDLLLTACCVVLVLDLDAALWCTERVTAWTWREFVVTWRNVGSEGCSVERRPTSRQTTPQPNSRSTTPPAKHQPTPPHDTQKPPPDPARTHTHRLRTSLRTHRHAQTQTPHPKITDAPPVGEGKCACGMWTHQRPGPSPYGLGGGSAHSAAACL